MAKPKAITRAIVLLQEAPIVRIDHDGQIMGEHVPKGTRRKFRLVEDTEAADLVVDLKRADARTRLDPTKRRRRTPPRVPMP